MGIRRSRSLERLCDELEDRIETEKHQRRLWYVESQTLPVICHLNFTLPTEPKETQVRKYPRKVESLEETCVDYEGTILNSENPSSNLKLRSYFLSVLICCNADADHFIFSTSSELDQLRTETQTALSGSASAAPRAANVISLNNL